MKQTVIAIIFGLIYVSAGYAQDLQSNAVTDYLEQLPLLPVHMTTSGQFSSHSPQQQNGDVDHYLYEDAQGDRVIFDVIGPGCIKSMWGTALDTNAVLKFYFNGDSQPTYEVKAVDFYQGHYPTFPKPLVSYENRGYYIADARAGNSFVPISFDRSLRISVEGRPSFYHILYEKYPYGTLTDSLRQVQQNYISSVFRSSGTNIWKGRTFPIKEKTGSLSAHQDLTVFEHAGAGSIRSLMIETDSSKQFLKEVFIGMIWDDVSNDKAVQTDSSHLVFEKINDNRLYQVMAPIGMFFASPDYVQPVTSLPIAIKKLGNGRVRLICNLVMPYWHHGKIVLLNKSDSSFKHLKVRVMYDDHAYPENKSGYFTTFYHKGITTYGQDWVFAQSPGTGWYLGTVQSCRLEHYCEGNEHFYMDENRTPQINGTGTEDYYLGCFWPNRKYQSPFAGCVNDVRLRSGGDPNKFLAIFKEDYLFPAVYYRFHLEMPIPFYSSISALIQHGADNQIASEYASLAYLYLRRKPVLVETDYLKIGNQVNMAAHQYHSTDAIRRVNLSARYEGNESGVSITDQGLYHKTGDISFDVAIHPENTGVRIRRRSDQSVCRQQAKVYVDGQFAGTWYDPQINKVLRWYDSEFNIPEYLTKNKNKLHIRLELTGKDNDTAFTDFEYRVLSYEHPD